MRTMPKIYFLACLLLLPISACNAKKVKEEGLTAPSNWKVIPYSDWNKLLDIENQCLAKFDGNQKRFVNLRVLDSKHTLVSITCEMGAYQDAKKLFVVNHDAPYTLQQLKLNLPTYDETWSMIEKDSVWGGRYVEGKNLVIENRFAGSGQCGYMAYYSIEQILQGGMVKPIKVHGDADCENEVYLDDWPQIKGL